MKSILVALRGLAVLLTLFLLTSCGGGGQAGCPTCGTQQNGAIALIDVMLVPEHNPNGEPGGPFNIFDIGWVDPTTRTYTITDRLGLDVPVFSTTSNVALWVIGGDNTVAENGNDFSSCWTDGAATNALFIPPTMTGMGNFTRFGCKTLSYHLSGSGANGHFGGFLGGQCCASRANNLNPLTGPNGLEESSDGNFAFISNGSSTLFVFDMAPLITSNYTAAPLLTAAIPTGTSPDYDGPNGITPCASSANGRAFSDPTCGDLRADELATTGKVVHFAQDGSDRFLVAIINGDPGNAFVTIIDATGVVTRSSDPVKAHCLPYSYTAPNGQGASSVQSPFSPGPTAGAGAGPAGLPPANYSTCVLGQIYYDFATQNDISTFIDDQGANAASGNTCPNVQEFFIASTGAGGNVNGVGPAVPSGASGHAKGFNPDIPCHHGPMLTFDPTKPGVGGQFCAPGAGTPAGCVGSGAPAGLGGLAFMPQNGTFLATNGNSTPDLTVGSVDVIDPLHAVTVGGVTKYVPVVVNSFPIYNCMPTGLSPGPGTDVLVSCADHDGRAFAPSTVIINGLTGAVLATFNQIGFSDQTWYNPGDNHYYVAGRDMPTGPRLGVIDAGTRTWLVNIPTNGNAHSVAADPINNHIFVPLPAGGSNCQSITADGCVGVYGAQ